MRIMGAFLIGAAMVAAMPASADKIKNPTAVFAGLDKITGRIISFEVGIGETVQFGALQLTPRICYSRPPTETANSTSFIEVDEITFSNEYRRIFSGWMFAASPGLHGIEHAVYDIWLTDCKGGTEIIKEEREPEQVAETPKPGEQPKGAQVKKPPPPKPRAQTAATPPRIDVAPQQGISVEPRQPTQRFFPVQPSRPIDLRESGR